MTAFLKILSSVIVFVEVAFFAYLPYLHPKLGANKVLTTLISCFTSGLFLGLALIHVLPQSNQAIAGALAKNSLKSDYDMKAHPPQYGSIIAIFTFIIILAIDTYFHQEIPPTKDSDDEDEITQQEPRRNNHMGRTNKLRKQKSTSKPHKLKKPFKNSTKVLLTQAALSIHSFFECMSLGIQTDVNTTMTLLFGIAIHKWAEGLTLGYQYKGVNMPKELALKYSLLHASLNSLAVFAGWSLASNDDMTAGILSSVSAGTFLYVCMVEKIQHEFKGKEILSLKVLSMCIGVIFVCLIS